MLDTMLRLLRLLPIPPASRVQRPVGGSV